MTFAAATEPTLVQRTIRLAGLHDSVLATHQLRTVGVDGAGIQRWLAQELLTRLHYGVYLVGINRPTMRGRLRAATIRGGPSSWIDGLGALWLCGVVDREPPRIELLSTSRAGRFDGVTVARTTSLPERERRDHDGIRAVSVARAITDLAPRYSSGRVLRWMRSAEFRGVLDIDDLRASEHRLARRGHGDRLRSLLREFEGDGGGTDSGLEDLLLGLMMAAGLPRVTCGQEFPGVLRPGERVDFSFAGQGLIVEADGPHHLEPMQRQIDQRRDRALRHAGFRVLRFWWYEIEDGPVDVLDRIRAALDTT